MIVDKANAALDMVYSAKTPEELVDGLCRVGRHL